MALRNAPSPPHLSARRGYTVACVPELDDLTVGGRGDRGGATQPLKPWLKPGWLPFEGD